MTDPADTAARLQLALDSAEIGTYEIDLDTNASTWDDRVYDFWGVPPGRPITLELILAGVHPDERTQVVENITRIRERPDFVSEHRLIGIETGRERVVELRHRMLYEDGRPRRLVGIVTDITALRKREADLRRLTRLYAALGQVSQAVVRAKTTDDVFREVCRALVEHGGFRRACIEVDGAELAAHAAPAPAKTPAAAQTPHADLRFSVSVRGEERAVLSVEAADPADFGPQELRLLEQAAAEVGFGIEHVEGDQARLTALEELRRSARTLELATAAAGAGVWVWEVATGTLSWDARMHAIHGTTPAEFRGVLDDWIARLHPEDKERSLAALEAAGRGEGAYDPEFRIVRPDGAVRHVKADATVIRDASGQARRMVGLNRDVTAEREAAAARAALEAQLVQAQKLEAIGTLAAGIAHDFNNILMPLMAHAELALRAAGDEQRVRDNLGEILRAGGRARDLAQQVLAVSRPETAAALEPLNLATLVRETVRFLAASLPRSIEIRTVIDPACGLVLGNASQLQQVLLNLCTNARDAMGDAGGVLTIALEPAEGGRTRLRVSDTGCGIDPALLDRVFEPWVTTKPRDQGSGLGLAVTRRIVDGLGGEIRVASTPGHGATFDVLLPTLEADAAPAAAGDPEPPCGRGERILVIDDEETVARVLELGLESFDFAPTACTSAAGALALFRADPGAFDAVICDLSMPDISGLAVAEQLLTIRPDLPILLSTGYADPADELRAKALGVRGLLTKPYALTSLVEVLRGVLP